LAWTSRTWDFRKGESKVKNVYCWAALAVVLTPALGCGGGGSGTVSVDAKITVNGQAPTGSALISLTPKSSEMRGKTMAGYLSADGSAVFWTDGDQDSPDGLPVGEYTLALRMDPMNPAGMPSAEPYDLKVEQSGTLTIDLTAASGPRTGLGMPAP
jgi:hypothetical protein